MRPADDRVVVPTPGRPEPLSYDELVASVLEIQAMPDNTGLVYVGSRTVRAGSGMNRGFPLLPTDTCRLDGCRLCDVFVDAVVAGEGVVWGAVVEDELA